MADIRICRYDSSFADEAVEQGGGDPAEGDPLF